jgi:hypothetical protein
MKLPVSSELRELKIRRVPSKLQKDIIRCSKFFINKHCHIHAPKAFELSIMLPRHVSSKYHWVESIALF